MALTPEQTANRLLLRARDAIDRDYERPLDIPALARIALCSEAHFIRSFRRAFGETPHRYLQRRRVERAMWLLRATDRSVSEICLDVGFVSFATFSRTFRAIVGESPSSFRRHGAPAPAIPTCFEKAWTRPSSFGQAGRPASA
jgi:transcriptional regulator GlxA family with amidase domain